jgi:hypothetical protein
MWLPVGLSITLAFGVGGLIAWIVYKLIRIYSLLLGAFARCRSASSNEYSRLDRSQAREGRNSERVFVRHRISGSDCRFCRAGGSNPAMARRSGR